MHIIFATLTELHSPGGDIVHVLEVSRELARSGAQVTLIASGKSTEQSTEKLNIIGAGYIDQRFLPIRLMARILVTVRILYHVIRLSRKAKILYTRDALLGWWFHLLSAIIKLPVVFEVNGLYGDEAVMRHGLLGGQLRKLIGRHAERVTVHKARAIICVTNGIRDVLAQDYGVPGERMHVVHNGVNLKLFVPTAAANRQIEIKKRFSLHADDAIIVYLGRLQPWQDLPTVLEAVGQLQIQNRNPVLLVVGGGDQLHKLEEQAKQLPNQAKVVFVGNVPYREVPPYICLADVCVMPFTKKRNEKIGLSPIKLYSYLACGKPVVATDIKGLEFLAESQLGTLVPSSDTVAFAEALRYWLENPQDRDLLTDRIRKYAEQYCGWERTAKSVYGVCLNIAKGKAVSR